MLGQKGKLQSDFNTVSELEVDKRKIEMKAVSKVLESLAEDIDKEVKRAKKKGYTFKQYDAPARESNKAYTSLAAAMALKTFDVLFGQGPSRHNAFNALSMSDIQGLPGFAKLHQACEAADIGLQVTSREPYYTNRHNGITLHFDKPYSAFPSLQQATEKPFIWSPKDGPRM